MQKALQNASVSAPQIKAKVSGLTSKVVKAKKALGKNSLATVKKLAAPAKKASSTVKKSATQVKKITVSKSAAKKTSAKPVQAKTKKK